MGIRVHISCVDHVHTGMFAFTDEPNLTRRLCAVTVPTKSLAALWVVERINAECCYYQPRTLDVVAIRRSPVPAFLTQNVSMQHNPPCSHPTLAPIQFSDWVVAAKSIKQLAIFRLFVLCLVIFTPPRSVYGTLGTVSTKWNR